MESHFSLGYLGPPFLGVLINVNDLPDGTQWLAIIGYIRWSFEVSLNLWERLNLQACVCQGCINAPNRLLFISENL